MSKYYKIAIVVGIGNRRKNRIKNICLLKILILFTNKYYYESYVKPIL